jgi:long-chain acyl-CoA synthetase
MSQEETSKEEAMSNAPRPERPWIASYPAGIDWQAPIDLTPVHEQLLAACAKTPKADALDFFGNKTTFGELSSAVEAFAGALQAKFGVDKGTRVALLLPNTPFYVIAYFGVLRAGGTVVNCNPLYSLPELTHICGNSGADIIVTVDLDQLFRKAEALVGGGHVSRMILADFISALPAVKRVLFKLARGKELADASRSGVSTRITHFADMLKAGHKPAPLTVDPKVDVAVQQYTGGTTGIPKGALLTHANIAANMSQIDAWGCGLFYPPTRVVAVLPFFHIFAMTVCMNVPLCSGAQVVMLPRFELKALLELLSRTGANVLPAVPTLVQALAKAGEKARPHLTALEVVISGGAPLSDEVRANWSKVSNALLAEGYGLTEASPVVCCAALRVPSKPMSIGLPLPGTDLRFIEVDTGAPVGIGERGELQVKGPQVMLGYYNNPEATEAAFSEGWLRTGDIGYVDEDGYVFLVDRIKDLIICSGFNVYPRNIEEAIMHHPAVEEVNVIGVPDEYRGEAPVAFVKLREGHSVTDSELKAFLADTLSRLEMPREVIFKDELPKSLIGKLSKKELRAEYASHKASHEPA